jgi:hypothetical protein
MKLLNPILVVASVMLTLLLFSCGSESTNSPEQLDMDISNIDYSEFEGKSLKEFGIPALIMLPDQTSNIGAAIEPEIIHEDGDFKWDVVVGPNFTMRIEDYGNEKNMVENEKERLVRIKFYTLEYLIDQPDLIMYKRTLNYSEKSTKGSESVGAEHVTYHCYGEKEIDGITYVLRSRDEGFHKPIIETMVKTIKSLEKL